MPVILFSELKLPVCMNCKIFVVLINTLIMSSVQPYIVIKLLKLLFKIISQILS